MDASWSKTWMSPNAGKKFFCAWLSISPMRKMYRLNDWVCYCNNILAFCWCIASMVCGNMYSTNCRWSNSICSLERVQSGTQTDNGDIVRHWMCTIRNIYVHYNRMFYTEEVMGMRCPKCGSTNCQVFVTNNVKIHSSTKGFGAGKACCGTLLLGPIGLLCGACGAGKSNTWSEEEQQEYWICQNCGSKFTQSDVKYAAAVSYTHLTLPTIQQV